MKRTLLAITLAAAIAPFTFARAPQQSGQTGTSGESQTQQPAKKHKKTTKKHKKTTKQEGTTTTTTPPQK